MDLKEWTIHHIKQKDLVTKDLISYKEEGDEVLCEYKEGRKAIYYCSENLELEKIKMRLQPWCAIAMSTTSRCWLITGTCSRLSRT
jgi:uncharacterized protein CbrC (UPF0167 family)